MFVAVFSCSRKTAPHLSAVRHYLETGFNLSFIINSGRIFSKGQTLFDANNHLHDK